MKLVFIDLETTGTDWQLDRIVSICVKTPDDTFYTLVDPEAPIPAAAAAVHGITNEMVRGKPPFARIAHRVQTMLDGAVIGGYNSKAFDVRMLDQHLRRAGEPGVPPDQPQIDVYVLWQEWERRTLDNAMRRYAGHGLEGNHDASVDAEAAAALLPLMLQAHGKTIEDALETTADSDLTRWVELKDGAWRFKFGRHRGQRVRDCKEYVQWLVGADFPAALKRLCEAELLAAVTEAS